MSTIKSALQQSGLGEAPKYILRERIPQGELKGYLKKIDTEFRNFENALNVAQSIVDQAFLFNPSYHGSIIVFEETSNTVSQVIELMPSQMQKEVLL